MKRLFAILIVAAFATAAIPAVDAGEQKTAHYDVPSGPIRLSPSTGCGVATCGPGLSTSFGSSGWDDEWWCLEDDDVCEEPLDLVIGTTLQTARGALGKGDGGIVNVGVFSSDLLSDCGDCYTTFLVSITDTLPADTYYSFCIITEYQDGRDDTDNWCGDGPEGTSDDLDDIEDPRTAGCGSASLTTTVPAGGEDNGATAFVYASHVDETTSAVCLGSSGTLTLDMS